MFRYRNYIFCDIMGTNEKITVSCYVINSSGFVKNTPSKLIIDYTSYQLNNIIVTLIYNVSDEPIDDHLEEYLEYENKIKDYIRNHGIVSIE